MQKLCIRFFCLLSVLILLIVILVPVLVVVLILVVLLVLILIVVLISVLVVLILIHDRILLQVVFGYRGISMACSSGFILGLKEKCCQHTEKHSCGNTTGRCL